MIDALFIVYPEWAGILGDISPKNRNSRDRYIDNALTGSESPPQTLVNAREATSLGDWIERINPAKGRLFLSTSIERPTRQDSLPQWADVDSWPDSIFKLMKVSGKVFFVTIREEDFIHDRIIGQETGMGYYPQAEEQFQRLHSTLSTLHRFSLGSSILVDSGRLHTQTELDKINYHTGQTFIPVPSRPRRDRPLWKTVSHQISRRKAVSSIGGQELELAEEVPLEFDTCQVLTVLGTALASWTQFRGVAVKQLLADHGIAHSWTHYGSESTLGIQIERSQCSLVINELWTIPATVVNNLATRFPGVRFVNMNHSSPSFMVHLDRPVSIARRMELLEQYDQLAAIHPNVYHGTVMGVDRFELNGSKVVSIPNPIRTPPPVPARMPDPKLLSLSLICRFCPMKNLVGQVAAVRMVAKERAVSLLIMTTYNPGMDRFVRDLRVAGVNTTVLEWDTWENVMHLIGLYVDIGLQVSLSESLNMVALEHMMLGKPVVGSQAIEYIPHEWQANPQDPGDIAGKILTHSACLGARGAEAKTIADRVCKENNQRFLTSIQSLLEL